MGGENPSISQINMDKKTSEDLLLQAASLASDHQTKHITEATHRVLGNAGELRRLATKWQNVAADKAQGHMFEQLEVIKFNFNTLREGSSLHAATTASLGITNHEVVDVVIGRGKREIQAFQLKSGNKASSTAFMLADPKYADVGLVGPSDQHSDVQRLYKARISTGAIKAQDYASASKRLQKGIAAENVSSGGTEYDEALKATDPQQADKIAKSFERKGIASEMYQSGLEAGKIGAVISGGSSGISGLFRLARGEAGTGEIVAQVAIDAAKGFATSCATTAISKGVPHALVNAGVSQTTANVLTKSNAHLALAAGIVQCGKSLGRYLNGEIDDEQLLTEISGTAITGASAFYYGALGQAIIPIPIVGAFVGSTVGYFVGNMLHQSGLISLGEAAVVKAARERREHVEALCMTAIPLMRAHRLELEALLAEYFAERRHLLTATFDDLENSLVDWDADQFTAGLARVNNAFGTTLPFKTFDEFDNFMKDDSQSFVL
jgi:hypothetical protein